MWIKFAVALIIPLLLLATLIILVKQQYRQAGEILLVLPKPKWRGFILLGLTVIPIVASLRTQNALLIGAWYGITATLWLQLFFPLEFREKGIMISGSFVRWSRIKSYQWQEQDSQRLFLKLETPGWKRKWIRISPTKRSQVEHILQEKLV